MDLTVTKKQVGSSTILKVYGTLDISTVHIFNDHVEQLGQTECVVVDLEHLGFVDSSGIGAIMEVIYLSQSERFQVRVEGYNEEVKEILETIGFFQILKAFQEEAL